MNTQTTSGPGLRSTAHALSSRARDLHWLLNNLVDELPGVRSVAVVSSDGLLLLSSDPAAGDGSATARHRGQPEAQHEYRHGAQNPSGGPQGSRPDLATVVSGLCSLTTGAARLMDAGLVKQTMVAMDEGALFVMAISDGSLLGVHAEPDCDMSMVAYHMALFVGRAGHVLTPELRNELRQSMEQGR